MPTIDLDPCERCIRRLHDVLNLQGAEGLAAHVIEIMQGCASCQGQIPRRHDAVLKAGKVHLSVEADEKP